MKTRFYPVSILPLTYRKKNRKKPCFYESFSRLTFSKEGYIVISKTKEKQNKFILFFLKQQFREKPSLIIQRMHILYTFKGHGG